MIAGVLNIMVKEGVALAFYISHKEDFQELRPLNLLFFDIFKWSLKTILKYMILALLLIRELQIWGLVGLKKVLVLVVFSEIVLKFYFRICH